jgi:hypothetical protein
MESTGAPIPRGTQTFRPPAPRLRLEPILRFQRYRDLSQVAPPIREAAEAMATLAARLAEPEVVYRATEVAGVGSDTLTLLDGPTFHGRCLGTHVALARAVVGFILTIGPHLDARVAELAAGDELLEALFLDTAGWLAIEDALRAFRAELRGQVRPAGLQLSPRLGPGHLDWPLDEQGLLFALFAGEPLPVTLSEYWVMTPKKSISGLFGLLPSR